MPYENTQKIYAFPVVYLPVFTKHTSLKPFVVKPHEPSEEEQVHTRFLKSGAAVMGSIPQFRVPRL